MDGLIYNQNHIPKSQYRYGLRSSAATGSAQMPERC